MFPFKILKMQQKCNSIFALNNSVPLNVMLMENPFFFFVWESSYIFNYCCIRLSLSDKAAAPLF